ncbi:MAG: hypothetical protein DI527_18890 [Chelatococcus sp.]|nr:MAG: hypothetical protein DI527_18890 [Chelatococcus sp.]
MTVDLSDTPAGRIARLDASLARRGQDATLRRRIGTSAAFVDVAIRVRLSGYQTADLPAGVQATDSRFISSPTPLLAAGAAWPGAAGGGVQPKLGDLLITEGRQRRIEQVDNIVVGEWVRIEGRIS